VGQTAEAHDRPREVEALQAPFGELLRFQEVAKRRSPTLGLIGADGAAQDEAPQLESTCASARTSPRTI
jgi:hypothetical protein